MKPFLKQCYKCRRQKWNTSFHKDKYSSDGLSSCCKECNIEREQKHRQKYPEQSRNAKLKKNYNITIQQYEMMLKSQNGVCAICSQSEIEKDNKKGKIKRLAVDHNHLTGEIRGLLCVNCNRGIGHFQDNSELLRKAAT